MSTARVLCTRAGNPHRTRKGELNGGSTEYPSVGPRHAANRADGLRRGAGAGELQFQFQKFSNTPLASNFNEHAADTEIYRQTRRPLAVRRGSHANRPIHPIALRALRMACHAGAISKKRAENG